MRRFVIAALAVGVVCTGCLSGFKNPLGSAEESFIDQPLLGTWVCRSDDDPQPTDLTFVDFDGRQYLLQSDDHKAERYSHRVVGSRIEGATFLSLRPVAPKAEDEWTVLRYSFSDANHLSLRLVDPEPFEDVLDDAVAVRLRLADRLDDPDVIGDLFACARQEPTTCAPEQ
jgi:hypothetical protein